MELDPGAKVSNTGAKLPSVQGKLARWFCSVDRPSGVKKEFLMQEGICNGTERYACPSRGIPIICATIRFHS